HLASEQHMRAVFQQRHKSNLRISAPAAAGSWPPEGFLVSHLIGDIQGAAIQTHQPPTVIPGSFAGLDSDRLDGLIVQLLEYLPSQSCASLRYPRLAGHFGDGP